MHFVVAGRYPRYTGTFPIIASNAISLRVFSVVPSFMHASGFDFRFSA